jgi:hypothetical protein
LALDSTYTQVKKDCLKTSEGKVEQVGMQWNVNFERLTNKEFRANWVERIIKNLDGPAETTHINMIGKGTNTKIIWIPHDKAPQLWIWNHGIRTGSDHEQALKRAATHPYLQDSESQALLELANSEWTWQDIETCFNRFKNATNYTDEGFAIIGMNQPSLNTLVVAEAVKNLLLETKRQYPRNNVALKHAATVLTGGWNWLTGKRFEYRESINLVLRKWMRGRTEIKYFQENPSERFQNKTELPITSEEWATTFNKLCITEQQDIPRSKQPNPVTSTTVLKGYDSLAESSKATRAMLGGAMTLEEWLKRLQNTELVIYDKARADHGQLDGLVLHRLEHESLEPRFAAYKTGFSKPQEDSLADKIARNIKIWTPQRWEELGEIIKDVIKNDDLHLTIGKRESAQTQVPNSFL